MAVIPQEFFDHMRASAREQLLAWRSLLDNWVHAMEEREAESRARRQGPERAPEPLHPTTGPEGAGPETSRP